jgi:hypothetical protein
MLQLEEKCGAGSVKILIDFSVKSLPKIVPTINCGEITMAGFLGDHNSYADGFAVSDYPPIHRRLNGDRSNQAIEVGKLDKPFILNNKYMRLTPRKIATKHFSIN